MCQIHSRREFLAQSGAVALAVAGWPAPFRLPRFAELDQERPYLDAALKAWRWIDASRIVTDDGITWPADPLDPESLGTTLYSDSPGVVPFLLELFYSTGREEYLTAAQGAVDHLAAHRDAVAGAGLYTGLGGVAYGCANVFRASGAIRHLDQVHRCVERLHETADRSSEGVAWPIPTDEGTRLESNDIVSGTAGTALTLLHLANALGDDHLTELAREAGVRLLRRAQRVEGGRRWEMWAGYPREMPNFSHGTAGIAFALAELYRATDDAEFLDAAIDGARYVQSLATGGDDEYLIFHSRPGGEGLYYLGWCHGPVGTNRLFQALHAITGEQEWGEWVHRGARAILRSGIPERRTPGFWQNVSQCCGTAGVGEHFLALYRLTGEESYRRFADRLTDDLVGRSTEEHGGLKWTQAEHRVRPELLVAQTGFMQGAAGVGKYFLSLDRLIGEGRGPHVVLPDERYQNPPSAWG
jgi:lantibiotic modifying enzyme